jgi:hypothetical protein
LKDVIRKVGYDYDIGALEFKVATGVSEDSIRKYVQDQLAVMDRREKSSN